jgi:hypothetical protein
MSGFRTGKAKGDDEAVLGRFNSGQFLLHHL